MAQVQEITQSVDKALFDPTSKKSFMPSFPHPSTHPYPSSSARTPHHLPPPYSKLPHQDFPPPTMQPQLQSSFPQAPFPQPRPQAPKLPNPPHHASGDLAINGIVKALNDLQLEVVNMKNRATQPPRDRANVVCYGCNQKGHYKNECPNGP